jgi:DNA polymerase III epsilon subunit-like protein
MNEAVRRGTCLFGRDAARTALWKHIGPETIVVVHGGHNDFNSLRWIHANVIDTFMLESYTGIKTLGGNSLKNLCKTKLEVDVQDISKTGHCSLEDAMACRELVHNWILQIPDS